MWRIPVNSYTLIILVRSILLFWPPDIHSIWAIHYFTYTTYYTKSFYFNPPLLANLFTFSNFLAFLLAHLHILTSHGSGLGVKPLEVLCFLSDSQSFDSHPYPLVIIKQTNTIVLASSMNLQECQALNRSDSWWFLTTLPIGTQPHYAMYFVFVNTSFACRKTR